MVSRDSQDLPTTRCPLLSIQTRQQDELAHGIPLDGDSIFWAGSGPDTPRVFATTNGHRMLDVHEMFANACFDAGIRSPLAVMETELRSPTGITG